MSKVEARAGDIPLRKVMRRRRQRLGAGDEDGRFSA